MAKRSQLGDNNDAVLIDWFERWLGWFRGRGSRRPASAEPDLVRVRVDLIGAPPAPTAAAPVDPEADGAQASLRMAEEPRNPFLPAAPLSREAVALQRQAGGDWQFNQPVLLQRQRRPSSVLVWTAVGGSGAFLLWAFLAPLGETIAVQGKLQPGSRVKEVQAPVPGVIESVLVREGQTVEAGQELLRFDLRDARSKLAAAEAVRSRLQNENQIYAAALGDGLASGLTANQRLQLSNQALELNSRRESALQALRQSEERLRGLRSSAAIASSIEKRYSDLVRSGAASEVQLLDSRDKAQQLRSSIAQEDRQRARLEAELTSSQAAPGADLRGRIEANLRQISDLDSQIRQARLQIQYGELRATTSGVVFDLDVGRGSVVEATKPMLKLVPGDALEAKVYVPSKAIGFLAPGQPAELSLDTFPAHDYGYVNASVLRIGSDALTPEEMQATLGSDAQGLVYPAILRLKRQTLQAGGRAVPLKAGMSLTADIRLRQRTFAQMVGGMFSDKRRELERLR